MSLQDLAKPGPVLTGLAVLAAGTLAVGYLVLRRDRESLERVVRVAAGTVERASAAFAEAREELGDLWAQARDAARQEIEDAEFAQAPGSQVDEVEAEEELPPPPGPRKRSSASRTRRVPPRATDEVVAGEAAPVRRRRRPSA
jgi:hypothetical protein